mmetsp:Transcript_119600/g.345762  ORF Transcript_119600/g.345762 Transcript_119600/m.345762 type:complete len:401 (+) Transcript_119600:88-1290(+)
MAASPDSTDDQEVVSGMQPPPVCRGGPCDDASPAPRRTAGVFAEAYCAQPPVDKVRPSWAIDDLRERCAERGEVEQTSTAVSCAEHCRAAAFLFTQPGIPGRRRPQFGSGRPENSCSGRRPRGGLRQKREYEVDECGFRRVQIPDGALRPFCQARFCVAGLLLLGVLRGCAARVCISPVGLSWTSVTLSGASDMISVVGMMPMLISKLIGACVQYRCLGSLLTLLLTAAVCNIGSAIMFLSAAGGIFSIMGPVAADEGAPKPIAIVGVWECIMLSSVSLELALCVSAWQFYGAFREAGIYPPNGGYSLVQKEVSPLEFLCEAEDVALLSDQCPGCSRAELVGHAEEIFGVCPAPHEKGERLELDDGVGTPDVVRHMRAASEPELRSEAAQPSGRGQPSRV